MPKDFRIYWKLASYFLLLAAAGHTFGHYVSYVDESRFSLTRRALAAAMKAFTTNERMDTSMWTMLQMFSLSFSLFLAFAGLVNLFLLYADPPRQVIKIMAGFNVAFWVIAFCLFLFVHPVIQPIVISSVVALLFGVALWRLHTQALPS